MRVAFFALITISLAVIAFILADGYNTEQRQKKALQAIIYEEVAEAQAVIEEARPALIAEYVRQSIYFASEIAPYDNIIRERPLTDKEEDRLALWTEQKAVADKFLNELQSGGCNVPEIEGLCGRLAVLREKLLFI